MSKVHSENEANTRKYEKDKQYFSLNTIRTLLYYIMKYCKPVSY